jgi:hypothetical protein
MDTSLASLDTADLGAVAVEDPGGVVERAAGLFTEAAQRSAENPAADGRGVGHQGTPFLRGQRRRWPDGGYVFSRHNPLYLR